jgi:hypothetical protein
MLLYCLSFYLCLLVIVSNSVGGTGLLRARSLNSLLWYVGHTYTLAGCKSLYTPRWEEVLANGNGVVGDGKSEGSHSQKRGNDVQKLDTMLTGGGQASHGLRTPQNQP